MSDESCAKSSKLLIVAAMLMLLSACVGNDSASGGGVATAATASNSAKSNQVTLQWALDGENINTINKLSYLNDMAWHLVTVTVEDTGPDFVPALFDGIQTHIVNPMYGENAQIKDINCNGATFSKVGDSCSAYIKISYAYNIYHIESAAVKVFLYSGNLRSFPNMVSVTDNINQTIGSVGDYRVIESIESQYYAGNMIVESPTDYQMLLMQNGEVESIAITNLSTMTNTAFTLMQRSESGADDPYYGGWHQCALVDNHALGQVSNLKGLNDSCILVYQAESAESITTESAAINVATNAQNTFPLNVGNYTLQAAYNVPTATFQWQQALLPESQSWDSLTYGNGEFVAISGGINGSDVGAYSSNGINWTATNLPANQYWDSVTYGNGEFVTVSDGDVGAYSPNGINWTATNLPANQYWAAVTYGNGEFVAVGDGDVGAYSPNGVNWIQATLPESQSWNSVAYGNGKFVAVAFYDNDAVAYSSNGINWTSGDLPESQSWSSVTYGNGVFVAVGNSNIAAYSPDGINWTATNLPANQYWYSVVYAGGMFVATAFSTSSMWAYSSDGIHWVQVSVPYSQVWNAATYGDGELVIVSGSPVSFSNAVALAVLQFNDGQLSNFIMYPY